VFPLSLINNLDLTLPRVRLVSKAYTFWGVNDEAEMETYWATPILRRWPMGRTLLTAEQASFSTLIPKKPSKHLVKRVIHKFYTPHSLHGYYPNKRTQRPRRRKYLMLKAASRRRINNRPHKNILPTPARWNVFFQKPNHALDVTLNTIYNKEAELEILNQRKRLTRVELPWASLTTLNLKSAYFNEAAKRRSFSFSWRRCRVGQRIRLLKLQKRSYRPTLWLSRISREYSTLQQIFKDFALKEHILKHGFKKLVLKRTRSFKCTRLNQRWRRRKLKKFTLKRQKMMHQKMIFRRRRRKESVFRRRNRIIRRYYKLLQYRSGYKWRALTSVTAIHRMSIKNYSIMRFDPFVKKKRRTNRRFKRRRKWLPKGFYRYRRRYKRLIKPIRLHGWTWFNLPIGNDYVIFDDRRIGFVKEPGTFYFPKIVRKPFHTPKRIDLQITAHHKFRNYNRSVAGVTRRFSKTVKALNGQRSSRNKYLKPMTLNPKSVQRYSLYKQFAATKGDPKVDQRPRTMTYEQILNGRWSDRFKKGKDSLSRWVIACHEKDKPYHRGLVPGFDVSTKFFNLFLRKGAKHTLEKLIRQFKIKNPRWSPMDLYHKLYTPVGLLTSTKIKIKQGKLHRVKKQLPKINRWQKAFIKARKWIIMGVRGRRERQWWSRVTGELTTLRSSLRLRKRYIRSIATIARVL